MIGERGKNWIEVERTDAKLLKVIKMTFDTRQVAPIKRHHMAVSGCRLTPGKGSTHVPVTRVRLFDWVVAGVAIGKAIREDLIEN